MAKFLSQVYTAIRGSVGGVTYTANKYATLLARSRVTPTQPDSSAQNRLKSAFTIASTLWKNITQAGRDGWDSYAATCPYPGPLGNYYVDGRTLFLGTLTLAYYLNNLFGCPTTLGGSAPTDTGWLGISIGDPEAPATGTGFKIVVTNVNTEDVVLESARTRPQNITRNTWHGAFDTDTLDASVIVGEAAGQVQYTDLTAGKVYFVRLRFISDDAPHRISQQFIIRAVAVSAV